MGVEVNGTFIARSYFSHTCIVNGLTAYVLLLVPLRSPLTIQPTYYYVNQAIKKSFPGCGLSVRDHSFGPPQKNCTGPNSDAGSDSDEQRPPTQSSATEAPVTSHDQVPS